MLTNKKKGFSLVELMVVIAIMTILMMAAISFFLFIIKPLLKQGSLTYKS